MGAVRAWLRARWADRPGRWAWPLWACAGLVVAGIGFARQEHTIDGLERQQEALEAEIEARRISSCEAGNDTRALIRRMSRDAPLEVGEAIIEVASREGNEEPPDPAVIDQFREVMARRLEGIVNQLPARRWDPEAGECVDIPLDTGG